MPVFEQGYKHWEGDLSGHLWRWWTIARQGIRVALQGWMLRILTMLAMTPAVALVGVFVLWGFVVWRRAARVEAPTGGPPPLVEDRTLAP